MKKLVCALKRVVLIPLLSLIGMVDIHAAGIEELPDKQFLKTLLSDTWSCLDDMIHPDSGLPADTQHHKGMTNTTNIGLYLSSLCVAKEIGLIEKNYGESRLVKILSSLEKFQRIRGFMPNFINLDMSHPSSQGIMAVSDFNKLAVGLIMCRQTWPELSGRITAFLEQIEWHRLYNREKGFTSWGYDLSNDSPTGGRTLMLTADTRLATYMLVATQAAPPSIWNDLHRDPSHTKYGTIFAPGYGFGALFMHAMDGLFIPEVDTEVGMSVGNLAWHQIQFAKKRGYPLWGWSNCYIPQGGYTEGGYLPEQVVTPNALSLAIEYYPKHVIRSLKEMVRLGGTIPPKGFEGKQWGLRDSYNMSTGKWDDRYLSLDQSMVFLPIANYLHNGIVRSIYTKDPLVQKGTNALKPYIQKDATLPQRWASRDQEEFDIPVIHSFSGISKSSISLNHTERQDPHKLLEVTMKEGKILTTFNNKGTPAQANLAIHFPAKDLSHLSSIEFNIKVPNKEQIYIGYLRVFIEDKFGQRKLGFIKLKPTQQNYSIQSKDLFGILFEEESVNSIYLEFTNNPWYYKHKNLNANNLTIEINNIEFFINTK